MYKRKSKFWTFAFSFLPGLGHLYLGLQRRGTQLMVLFFSYIFLVSFLEVEALGVFAPVIWFYSMFDAMSKVSSEEYPYDEDIGIVKWLKGECGTIGNKSKYIGFGLVGLGGYLILIRIVLPVVEAFLHLHLVRYIQTSVIAAVLILIGFKLLSGEKSGNN